MNDPAYWAMFASLVFLAFLVFQVRVSREPSRTEARRRYVDARRRARDVAGDPGARAEALRGAAKIALDGLERPALAARLARAADKIDPNSAASVETLVLTMSAAGRYHALERLLWKHLDEASPGSEAEARNLSALLALYDGPLRRPHQASALRRLSGLGVPRG